MTREECIALLDRYANYNGMGIPNLAGCKEAMKKAVELLSAKPSEDLEEAARLYSIPHYMKDIDVNYIEEYPYDSGLEAAFKAGAEWQKVQMLEEAVEGYVNYYEDSGGVLMAEAQIGCPYHNGDKVKIIIVKEDKE